MKAVKLALIVALFTAGTGAVDALAAATGENWFVPAELDLPQNDWQSLAGEIDRQNSGLFDSVFSILYYAYLIATIVWGALKGILFIGAVLAQIFYYEVNGVNIAAFFCYAINAVVWIIYIIGFYQLRHGDSIKHYW
ncbi:hypothetical protein MsAg5_13210 [Methanosarcinaceae archaeon Ag5]|uniref:Uncharacterized protein n=1 Tax=Methanolapillus africanus TaxID=3028297 RepID=A0AAE4SDE3_9EURY|nr:hypothetical protein [Methanosarcinaceae archaeon Ag5]